MPVVPVVAVVLSSCSTCSACVVAVVSVVPVVCVVPVVPVVRVVPVVPVVAIVLVVITTYISIMNDTPIATQACSHITFIACLIFDAITMHLIYNSALGHLYSGNSDTCTVLYSAP